MEKRSGKERRSGAKGRLSFWFFKSALLSHFFTGIFPSWLTCSFSFVYLKQRKQA